MSTRPPPGRDDVPTSSDLVERLEAPLVGAPADLASHLDDLCQEAAIEIKRLSQINIGLVRDFNTLLIDGAKLQSRTLTIEAETREACAVIADEARREAEARAMDMSYGELYGEQCSAQTASEIATAIRAAGKEQPHG